MDKAVHHIDALSSLAPSLRLGPLAARLDDWLPGDVPLDVEKLR